MFLYLEVIKNILLNTKKLIKNNMLSREQVIKRNKDESKSIIVNLNTGEISLHYGKLYHSS